MQISALVLGIVVHGDVLWNPIPGLNEGNSFFE